MSGVKVILSLAFSKERVESMKVLMLNGSAKKEGNTYQSLLEVGKELERQGIEYEIFQIGRQPVRVGSQVAMEETSLGPAPMRMSTAPFSKYHRPSSKLPKESSG